MSAILTARCHRLAESLAELKVKVRAALATELAQAVGTAVRDVLVVALIDRLVASPRTTPSRQPTIRPTTSWRDDVADREDERDQWGYRKDSWDEPDEDDRRSAPARYPHDEPAEVDSMPAVPTTAAIAVGVNVGRWWMAKKGTVAAAVVLGVLATGLGLAGGPVARATLAVLAAASDVLTAESALARTCPS
ncbi:unnamed protein product [Gemmataceae bacterium]|nr:unnamed protein product [Gemmataceae bacterium]VTT98794.1 unnamed protein product [Gemmataceae bacterium]